MALIDVLDTVSKTGNDLFVIDLEGTEIIFRLPSYKKASQYAQLLGIIGDNYTLQCIVYEHIFEEFALPEMITLHGDDIHAGIPETIAKLILYLSSSDLSFQEYTEQLLETYRANTDNIISVMQRCICQSFGGYKMSDLDELDFQQLTKVYVAAEKVMLENGTITIEEILRFKEPEVVKPFKIESVIQQDAAAYKKFDTTDERTKLTDQPEYIARLEAFNAKYNKGG